MVGFSLSSFIKLLFICDFIFDFLSPGDELRVIELGLPLPKYCLILLYALGEICFSLISFRVGLLFPVV